MKLNNFIFYSENWHLFIIVKSMKKRKKK